MKKIIILLIVGILAWKGYSKYQSHNVALASEQQEASVMIEVMTERKPEIASTLPLASHKCDGRVHCSQMTSCEEATFFLRNCPGVKMDGNNDGVPCEMQWCK
jgi:predicted negative regulator of RcsB-dependent stress response